MPEEKNIYRIKLRSEAAEHHPKSGYVNSARMIFLALAVVAFHVFGMWAWHHARAKNSFLLQRADVKIADLPGADPMLERYSDVTLRFPCEFFSIVFCGEPISPEPRSVRRLRHELSVEDSSFLRGFRDYRRLLIYLLDSGLSEDYERLVADGLLTHRYDRQLDMLRFTATWHLAASLSYWSLNRYEDAVSVFQQFVHTGAQVSRDDYWISLSGLDLTDVAVISASFCLEADKLRKQRCLFGFLDSIASKLPLEDGGEGVYSSAESTIRWYLHEDSMSVAKTYAALPEVFRDPDLEVYLQAAEQVTGREEIDSELLRHLMQVSARPKRAAIFYLLGRNEILRSSESSGRQACLEALDLAQRSFEMAVSEDELDLFARPARRKISGLERLREHCLK